MIKTDGKIVHDDISKDVPGAYPWQYKEYDIRSLIFMPIEPDINLYWNERAIFRKGYNVDNNTKEIYIPNFFIKINGKHKNDKEYIEFVRFLMESKNTLVINNKFDNNFPGYYLNLKNNEYSKSIKEYIENCKFIDKKKDIVEQFVEYYFEKEKRNNKFSSIVYDKQLQIKKILINTIKKNIEIWKANDLDNLLEVYFNIPESMAILINNFDYNYDIPKIVCLNVRFNKKDAYLINLLNELAFDIIILDVTGKTTIEKYVDIMSLSLGYFDNKFNTYDKCLSFNKKISNAIKNVDEETWGGIVNISTIVISSVLVILGLFFFNGWVNTIVEIVTAIIVMVVGKFLCNACLLNDEDAHGFADIIYCVIIGVILFVRLLISGIDTTIMPDDTMTYTGTLNIADHTLDTKNDYVIHSNKNAVILYGTDDLNIYIENNEINENDIYFKIYYGDELYYFSSSISPYEYINLVDLEYKINSYNETEKLTIKYFLYNDDYTGELLGSEEITLHIAGDKQQLEDLLDEFNFTK